MIEKKELFEQIVISSICCTKPSYPGINTQYTIRPYLSLCGKNLPKGTWRYSWFSSLNSETIHYCSPFHFPFMCTLFQERKRNNNDKTDVVWIQSLHALEPAMLLLLVLDSCSSPMLTRYRWLSCFARSLLMQELFLQTTALSKPVKCLQQY